MSVGAHLLAPVEFQFGLALGNSPFSSQLQLQEVPESCCLPRASVSS